MQAKDRLGRYGEQLAVEYLGRQGMTVLDRNWRCRQGEIDIVARDGDAIVVCEVKTRSGLGYGPPMEGVDPRKLERLHLLADLWLDSHPESGGSGDVRVDVIGVLCEPERTPVVDHLRGAC